MANYRYDFCSKPSKKDSYREGGKARNKKQDKKYSMVVKIEEFVQTVEWQKQNRSVLFRSSCIIK